MGYYLLTVAGPKSALLPIGRGERRKLIFERRRKFALAFIPNCRRDLRYAHIGFPQQFSRLFHAVLFDMRRKGGSIDRFEYSFQGGWIDMVLFR